MHSLHTDLQHKIKEQQEIPQAYQEVISTTGLLIDTAPASTLATPSNGQAPNPMAQDINRKPAQCPGCENLRQAGEELAAHLTGTRDNLTDREQELKGVRKELEIMSETVAFKAVKALSFLRFRSSEDGTTSTHMTALKLNTAEPNVVGLSRPKPGNNFQNEEETKTFEFNSVLHENHNNNDIWHAFLPFTASLHIDHSVLLILDGPTCAGKS